MPATEHSLFSASNAKRLLSCPGSYGLSLAVDDGARRASAASAEGTLAHLLAEAVLASGAALQQFVGRSFEVDGFSFEVTQPLLDAVGVYVRHVSMLRGLNFQILLEARVDPSGVWRDDFGQPPIDLFGTTDCLAFDPSSQWLVIVDLKFGKGVVEPEENPQLLYYAAGAIALLRQRLGDPTWLPKDVTLTVAQPRLPHGRGPLRSWHISGRAVQAWAVDTLRPGVAKAVLDMGETLVAGEHCQFCPVQLGCPALRAMTLDVARGTFLALPSHDTAADPTAPDPLGLSKQLADSQLVELLNAGLVIKPLLDALKAEAIARIERGTQLPGWEVVQRATRSIWTADRDTIMSELVGRGIDPLPILTLATPAAVRSDHNDIYLEIRQWVEAAAPATILQPATRSLRRRGRQTPQLQATQATGPTHALTLEHFENGPEPDHP